MTRPDIIDIARRAAALFAAVGFATTAEVVDPISANGLVEMRSGDVVLRVVRDRKQWFVEMRSASEEEWFDSRFVLAEVGDRQSWSPATNETELKEFALHLISLLPRWAVLFRPDAYKESKRKLNERERLSARDRLNV